MNTAKVYQDSNGQDCTIYQMIRFEPEWAANRIHEGEKAIAEVERLTEENAHLLDRIDKAEAKSRAEGLREAAGIAESFGSAWTHSPTRDNITAAIRAIVHAPSQGGEDTDTWQGPRAYVVLMRRWGNTEGHTYIAGVYQSQQQAVEAAEDSAYQRGGKYQYQIFECLFGQVKCVADTCGDQTEHWQDLLDKAQGGKEKAPTVEA